MDYYGGVVCRTKIIKFNNTEYNKYLARFRAVSVIRGIQRDANGTGTEEGMSTDIYLFMDMKEN